MSKQRIDEMKKFMQIAEGNVAEAKVDPKLRKAGKILMQVVDGLDREYEELMNGADGDAEEIEFAEHVAEDAEDYKKIVNMLMKGQGKEAAMFYDGLDTVSREFVYDHAYSDIEFLQKVFGDLGSDWLFLEYDDEYDESVNESDPDDTDWDAHWAREDGDEERADDLEWDAEWERMSEGWFDDLGTGEEFARGEKDVCKKCGREGCECGPDCDCEPVEEDKDVDGMGYYNVTISVDGEYPDEVETAVDYDTAVAAAKDVAEAWKKGRWQMQTWNKGDAKEWHVRGDDGRMEEWFVVIRVEPTDDADVEAWHGESIELDELAEGVLKEAGYADYVDWEEPGQDEPASKGKSDAVKKAAGELGLDVEDMPLSKQTEFDMDDYPEAEDEELGLRFD